MTTVMLSTTDHDLGLVPAKTATSTAQQEANTTGKPVTVRHPVTDKVIRTVKPKTSKAAAKAKPAAKAAKANGKAKAKPAAKAKAKATTTAKPKADRKPRGMVVKILALASRKNGVSPAELNKLTEWKGAPWKWLFSNPKGNGYCDRWNYSFKVTDVEGETRYCTTAKK